MSEPGIEAAAPAAGKGPPPPKGKGKGPPAPKGKGGPPPPQAAGTATPPEVAPSAAEIQTPVEVVTPDARPEEESTTAASKGPPSPKGKGKGGPPPKAKGKGLSYKEQKEAEQRSLEDRLSAAEGFTGKQLTAEEAQVLEEKGTEAQGAGEYNKFQPLRGFFACRKCGKPIYSHQAKFESGCGWPAFDKCYTGSIDTKLEDDGTGRVEITCTGCGGHLGHVFLEPGHNAKARSDQRHCANSLALQYVKHDPPPGLSEGVLVLPEPSADTANAEAAAVTVQIETPGDESTFAKIGDSAAIHYVGLLASTNKEFDSSLGGDPFHFVLGEGTVIKGWEEGVLQMSLGSKAKLLVPASLGYGAKGMPGAIPPGADLIFNVELVSINGKELPKDQRSAPPPAAAASSAAVAAAPTPAAEIATSADAPETAETGTTIQRKVRPSVRFSPGIPGDEPDGGNQNLKPLEAFRKGVRKAISMQTVASAFRRRDEGFSAANAVGVLEATLAEEEEMEAVMARWEARRGRTATVGADLNNKPDAISAEAIEEIPTVPIMRWRTQPGTRGPAQVLPPPLDDEAAAAIDVPAPPATRRSRAATEAFTSTRSRVDSSDDELEMAPKRSGRARAHTEAAVVQTVVQHFAQHQSSFQSFTFSGPPPEKATPTVQPVSSAPAVAQADAGFQDAVAEFKSCVRELTEAIAHADSKSARTLKMALRTLIANATATADKMTLYDADFASN